MDYYSEKLRNGEDIAPIEVYEVQGKGWYIQEGHHRYLAAMETGIPVPVKILPGAGPLGAPDWDGIEWKIYVNEIQFWGE